MPNTRSASVPRRFIATLFIAFTLAGCAYQSDLAPALSTPFANHRLTQAEFDAVQPDIWRIADVQRALGRPESVSRVGNFDGPIWTYRYEHYGTRMQFYVYLDAQGVVRQTGSGQVHEGNDRRRH